MNFRMGKILGFWVDAEYESRRFQVRQSKTELFRQILLECCASARSGAAASPPLTRITKSRRLMGCAP